MQIIRHPHLRLKESEILGEGAKQTEFQRALHIELAKVQQQLRITDLDFFNWKEVDVSRYMKLL